MLYLESCVPQTRLPSLQAPVVRYEEHRSQWDIFPPVTMAHIRFLRASKWATHLSYRCETSLDKCVPNGIALQLSEKCNIWFKRDSSVDFSNYHIWFINVFRVLCHVVCVKGIYTYVLRHFHEHWYQSFYTRLNSVLVRQ